MSFTARNLLTSSILKKKTASGVTACITSEASAPHFARTERSYEHLMRELGTEETNDGEKLREKVLSELQSLIDDWAVSEYQALHYSDEQITADRLPRLLTFGSYRLGVHGPGADIDTVVVCPHPLTEDVFFINLYKVLLQDRRATEVVAVTEARVPVIKFDFREVEIDLLMCRLAVNTIPRRFDPRDDRWLEGLAEASALSINGRRVNDSILGLVSNHPAFRGCLRAIKLWAKRRGIYSNKFGYFGGITWAICVARVCQLYPNFNAPQLLGRFFFVLARWDWEKAVLELCERRHGGHRADEVWSAGSREAKNHRMPILTPAYPSMNSTHNVSACTQRVLGDEFKRGEKICKEIEVVSKAVDAACKTAETLLETLRCEHPKAASKFPSDFELMSPLTQPAMLKSQKDQQDSNALSGGSDAKNAKPNPDAKHAKIDAKHAKIDSKDAKVDQNSSNTDNANAGVKLHKATAVKLEASPVKSEPQEHISAEDQAVTAYRSQLELVAALHTRLWNMYRKLFVPHPFFAECKFFLDVQVWACSKEELNAWVGSSDAKLRHFFSQIDKVTDGTRLHPFPKHFPDPTPRLPPAPNPHSLVDKITGLWAPDEELAKEESIAREHVRVELCEQYIQTHADDLQDFAISRALFELQNEAKAATVPVVNVQVKSEDVELGPEYQCPEAFQSKNWYMEHFYLGIVLPESTDESKRKFADLSALNPVYFINRLKNDGFGLPRKGKIDMKIVNVKRSKLPLWLIDKVAEDIRADYDKYLGPPEDGPSPLLALHEQLSKSALKKSKKKKNKKVKKDRRKPCNKSKNGSEKGSPDGDQMSDMPALESVSGVKRGRDIDDPATDAAQNATKKRIL